MLTFSSVSGSLFSVPIDQKQLPDDAATLRRMVLDLIAQLDAEHARRIKTENLLRQLLAARSGKSIDARSPEPELQRLGISSGECRGVRRAKTGSLPSATSRDMIAGSSNT